ncbi:hypothetical protein ACH4MM_05420 [Streptomyces pratensis]|uniref:nSTAND1 domain-containing NTPase n=1 Tax=Streptomyces pratensis TaxID=1169025 RepID=UPI00379AA7AD
MSSKSTQAPLRPEARELFRLLSGLAGQNGTAVLRVIATARHDSLDVLVTADTSDLVSEAVQFLAPLTATDLKLAVTAPVDTVPGLWFEPGLPKRIVADAGDEPGRMPLVQFALTELWQRRSRSMLTHAAYDDLGGVAGALVKYADGVYTGQLSQKQRELAPRLFAQLARPGDNDTFVRRPTRTADLAPELLELVHELAPGKLLVLSQAPEGPGQGEIVDLAHEALTELWPLLRGWLVESRDFRVWQEQLRTDLRRWQAQKSEPARLLGGEDLAEADRKLAKHRKDVSAEEHAFIQLSHRQSRRRIRVRRAAGGVLAVLTAISLVLAVSTWRGLQSAEEQLRLQAAGLLAQAAEDRPGNDPATALQFALAAWDTHQTPTTRQALLKQYVRGQYLLGSHPSVWKGRATDMAATPDGRVLVVESTRSSDRPRYTAISGALEGKPRAVELSGVPKGLAHKIALSPDGRFFAAMASTDGVWLWRLFGSTRPVLLPLAHEMPQQVTSTLDFSSDSKRLLTTVQASSGCSPLPKCPPAFAEAWEPASGSRIRVPDGLVPEGGAKEAAFTSDANSVVTISYTADYDKRIEIRDFRTARLRYTATVAENLQTDAWVGAGGELLVQRDGDAEYSQPLGASPGHRTELPAAGGLMDGTSRYHLADSSSSGSDTGLYDEQTLTDQSTGKIYHARVPSARDVSDSDAGLAAVPRPGGGLAVLAPVGSALMVVSAEQDESVEITAIDSNDTSSTSPNGRFLAVAGERSLQVFDSSSTRRQSVPLPDGGAPWVPTWTADSQRVVIWSRQGNVLAAYPVRDLADEVPLDDLLPGAKVPRGEGDAGSRDAKVEDLIALEGSRMALLTVGGHLTRIDTAVAAQLTRPFPAHPDPDRIGSGTIDDVFTAGRLITRPQHPGQVAAVTRRGAGFGDILLWDLRAPRHIATLPGLPITALFFTADEPYTGPLAFDASGSRLAVQHADGIRVWDVDEQKQLPGSAPGPTDHALIGISNGDRVLTYHEGEVTIHDLTDATASDTLHVPGWPGGYVRGDRLTGSITGEGERFSQHRLSFDLRPEEQFRALCAAAGRDYTKAERKLLPDGTPAQQPCA